MEQGLKAKDTEGLAGHYADGAYLVVPGLKPADGTTAIRQIFATASTDPAFGVDFASDKIDVAGDLAYARGKFNEKYTDRKTGKVMTDSGSYLTVYKKQDDGSWKVVEDFVVADPDSAKEVPPEKPAGASENDVHGALIVFARGERSHGFAAPQNRPLLALDQDLLLFMFAAGMRYATEVR